MVCVHHGHVVMLQENNSLYLLWQLSMDAITSSCKEDIRYNLLFAVSMEYGITEGSSVS